MNERKILSRKVQKKKENLDRIHMIHRIKKKEEFKSCEIL